VEHGADFEVASAAANTDERDIFADVAARRYFDHQKEWHQTILSPNCDYTDDIFSDKMNQHSINVVWGQTVQRKQVSALIVWVVFVAFFLYVAVMEGGSFNSRYHQFHRTVEDQFVGSEWNAAETKGFEGIGEVDEVWQWVDKVWLPKIYMNYDTKAPYYRKRGEANATQAKGSGRFHENLIFAGTPQIRQIRNSPVASKEECLVKTNFDMQYDDIYMTPCFKEWDSDDDYGDRTSFGPNNEYTFTDNDELTDTGDDLYPTYLMPSSGVSLYNSGFIMRMPNNATDAAKMVSSMKANNWIDMNTRIVLFEAAVTSANAELFTIVRLFIVKNAGGGFSAVPYIMTGQLNPFLDPNGGPNFPVAKLFFALAAILYIMSEVAEMFMKGMFCCSSSTATNDGFLDERPSLRKVFMWMKRQGGHMERILIGIENCCCFCKCCGLSKLLNKNQDEDDITTKWCYDFRLPEYMTNPFNIIDLTLISFFLVVLGLEITQMTTGWDMSWAYENDKGDTLYSIFSLASIQRRKLDFMAYLAMLLWLKTMQYIKITQQFALMVNVISSMAARLVNFVLILFIFLMAFSSYSYITKGISDANHRDFWTGSFIHTYNGGLGSYEYEALNEQGRFQSSIHFVLFSLALVLLMLNLLIAFMSDAYDSVKEESESVWAYMQLQSIVQQADGEYLHQQSLKKMSKMTGVGRWQYYILNSLNVSSGYRSRSFPFWGPIGMGPGGQKLKTKSMFVDDFPEMLLTTETVEQKIKDSAQAQLVLEGFEVRTSAMPEAHAEGVVMEVEEFKRVYKQTHKK